MRKKAKEKANVKILYLKCQFFPKKRAYFSLYCHLRNCIFMLIAAPKCRRQPRAQVSVSGGSPAGPPGAISSATSGARTGASSGAR